MLNVGCSVFVKPLTDEEINTQTNEIIQTIKSKPDWLNSRSNCPVDVIPEFEKEIFYLSEGCAKNPQKCFDKCKNNDGNACYSLALLIQDKEITQTESEPLFMKACELGIISGCTNRAAGRLNLEPENRKTIECAADTFEKTCERNDAWGCSMYGFVLSQGLGRKQNIDEALKFLGKSCEVNENDEACRSAKEIEKQISDLKYKKVKK